MAKAASLSRGHFSARFKEAFGVSPHAYLLTRRLERAAAMLRIVLMAIPGEPMIDADTKGQIEDLVSKGFAGTIFITTDDCSASYEELKGRGVEFTAEPEETPYGIDCGFRDPSGNSARLTEVDWKA